MSDLHAQGAAAFERFLARVRLLSEAEIRALDAVADWGEERVPVAFNQVAGLEYATDAYIEAARVFHLECPAAARLAKDEPTATLGASLAIADKGAAVAARHRLSGRNLDILEEGWRQAGLSEQI